jgi:spermidine synthase
VTRVWGWLRAYRYELIAALNGAIMMVLEIVGARIVAPHFGSSVYIWTAVIGVILGAMSVGYWYGGKVADKGANDRGLGVILMMAAAVLLVSLVLKDASLAVATVMGTDIRLQALVAALLLFAPANFLMGMVPPYLAKLKVANVATVGVSVGRLSAAGTLGSIAGTFAAGYWLIAWMGNRTLGLWLVAALIVASLMAERRWWLWARVGMIAGVAAIIMAPELAPARAGIGTVQYDGDSAYSRWQVIDVLWGGRPARLLTTDTQAAQSGIYLDKPNEPLFGYIRRFMSVVEATGRPERVLIVGGGTYTLPKLILDKYPATRVDVVEIDPKLDEIAVRYFGYRSDPRLRVIHEDGRTFLNANKTKYDVVLMDAFSSTTPPFQLATKEAVEEVSKALVPTGVVAVNLISARTGDREAFGAAEYTTYGRVFNYVGVGPVDAALPAVSEQNLIMVAAHDEGRQKRVAAAVGATEQKSWATGLVMTDDFAPVEQMTAVR